MTEQELAEIEQRMETGGEADYWLEYAAMADMKALIAEVRRLHAVVLRLDRPWQSDPPAYRLDVKEVPSTRVFLRNAVKWKCPVHGEMESTLRLWLGEGEPQEDYCMRCYAELIRKHCQRVKRVEPVAAAVPEDSKAP